MPPKAATVASRAALMASRLRMSMATATAHSLPPMAWASSATLLRGFEREVGDDDVGAAFGGEENGLAADAAGAADDESDAAAELFLGRLAADLGFFELPVLDAEGFAGRKGDVVLVDGELVGGGGGAGLRDVLAGDARAEGAGALHDADGVDVELAGDAGLGFVLAEAEHADAGDEDDGGAGVADGGRVFEGVLLRSTRRTRRGRFRARSR